MSVQKDILRSNNISGDGGVNAVNRSGCASLVYHYGNVWNNGVWNSFGVDLFNVRPSDNNYKLVVSLYFFYNSLNMY